MDGSSSAPDSDPESLELTEAASRTSDTQRELNELRARAYGRDADIDDDPAAVARLIEFEAAHVAAATAGRSAHSGGDTDSGDGPRWIRQGNAADPSPAVESPIGMPPITSSGSAPRRLRQRATAPRRRTWFIIGGVAVIGILVATVIWFLAPHPDATLRPIEVGVDRGVLDVLEVERRNPDDATLRRFEAYHGVDVWSVENETGNICLIVWDTSSSGRFAVKCAPPGRDVALPLSVESDHGDGFGRWLPGGSIVDFQIRENTVDVFVRRPQPAD